MIIVPISSNPQDGSMGGVKVSQLPSPRPRAGEPVLWGHLPTLRQLISNTFGRNVTIEVMCALLGMPQNQWHTSARNNPTKPITDSTIAIMVRFLFKHPHLAMESVEIDSLHVKLGANPERTALLLGKTPVSAMRWLSSNYAAISGQVYQAALIMQRLLDAPLDGPGPTVKDWIEAANEDNAINGKRAVDPSEVPWIDRD